LIGPMLATVKSPVQERLEATAPRSLPHAPLSPLCHAAGDGRAAARLLPQAKDWTQQPSCVNTWPAGQQPPPPARCAGQQPAVVHTSPREQHARPQRALPRGHTAAWRRRRGRGEMG
jgi:hypothetical protein